MNEQFIAMYFKEHAPRYLFGATTEAEALIKIHQENNLELTAVIDNFYSNDTFAGLPCIKLDDVPSDALIVSAVTNSRPIDVNRLLEKHHFKYCDYFFFYRYSGFQCPKIDFWDGATNHWQKHKNEYAKVKSWFEDDESVNTFDAVVGFRNNYDLSYMKGFQFDITNMYIEPFLVPFQEHSVFFDLGAFDGSDSERFLRHCPTGEAYLFEPIPSQVELLAAKYTNHAAIKVIPVAVGDTSKLVKFSLSGTSSKVVDNAESDEIVAVQQISMDEFCAENNVSPSYVKMDVEGVELDVLHGMADTILRCKPKLAISVYHRAEHLIAVPNYLKQLCPEYKFYLRHYTQGYSETVLFAV
ncbi:FkbM family methyltransferase [Pseudoalteromonas mariniglutinosa]|uniref:FkbM family methyltransferase n=1 Tax=Pseudoalteromonas mariniglutinosa TaxID=206042 RepID=UPI0038512158